jgi:acetone carboxylase gamma subunit
MYVNILTKVIIVNTTKANALTEIHPDDAFPDGRLMTYRFYAIASLCYWKQLSCHQLRGNLIQNFEGFLHNSYEMVREDFDES